MSLDPTLLTSGSDTTNAASYSTASISPTADRWLVVDVYWNLSGTMTVSGLSLTWNEEASTSDGGSHRIGRFYAWTGSSPGSGALTLTPSANAGGCAWIVYELHSATDTSDPFVQSLASTISGASTSVTNTLSAFGSSGNRPLVAALHNINEASTPETGYTEVGDVTLASPDIGLAVAYHPSSEDTSPSYSWATSSGNRRIISSEIKEGGGATNLVIQDASHAHGADSLALTQVHVLAIQDALHAHAADNVSLANHAIVRDALHSASAASTNIVVSKPSGLQAGDGMLAPIVFTASAAMVTPAPGWTFVRGYRTSNPEGGSGGTHRVLELYKKILTQAEADNPSQTWTWVKSNTAASSGGIIGLSGTSQDIVDDEAVSISYGEATTAVKCNGIRARHTDEIGVGFFLTSAASSSFTPDASMTEELDAATAAMTLEYATEVFGPTNFIPDRTATAGAPGNTLGIMVGVKSSSSTEIPAPTSAPVVQEAENSQDSGATLSVTFGAKPQHGNTVAFVVYPGADAAVDYITMRDPPIILNAAGDGTDVYVFCQSVLPDTSKLTYDFTISPSTAPSAIRAIEVEGVREAIPWDRIGMTDSDSGASTVTSQGTGTGGTTHEDDNWLLSIAAIAHNAPGTVSFTNGTNDDQVSAPTAALTLATAYREETSAGAFSDTASWTNAAKANAILIPFRIGRTPTVSSFSDGFDRSNEALENSGNWGVIEGAANVVSNRVDSVAAGADDDNMFWAARRFDSVDILVDYDEHTGNSVRASLALIGDIGKFGPSDTDTGEWGVFTGYSGRYTGSSGGSWKLSRHYRDGLMVTLDFTVEAEPALPYSLRLLRWVEDDGLVHLELWANGVLKVSYEDTHYLRVPWGRYAGLELKGVHTVDNFSAEVISSEVDLVIQDATHAHTADNLAMGVPLVIQDAGHAHTADEVALAHIHQLTIQDAAHAHTADNVTLSAWLPVNRRSLVAVNRRGA